jgi:hypothetical protein
MSYVTFEGFDTGSSYIRHDFKSRASSVSWRLTL